MDRECLLGGPPPRLVEASGELGYEEALSRGRLWRGGGVSCGGGTSQNESLFSN